ncbi:MAG: PilZ domain-containing protein [Oscillospiraceae bacterium]|nr:PilZ domain-containing protein [Oscillospiraceae bacterium]
MDLEKAVDDEIIIVGDKVDLVAQSGIVYRTMIEDRLGDGPFLAGVPNRKGVYMHVEQDDSLYLVFYRASGRYIAQMKVVAVEKRGEIRYMWMMQTTRAQKNQRREAFRLPVEFAVQIFEFTEDAEQGLKYVGDEADENVLETVNCRDISVTGIALLTKRKYEFDEKYILSLHLDRTPASIRTKSLKDSSPALHMTATVKRCIPWRTGNIFNTGMQFFGMTESMSDGIAKYVLNEQQKQIKRRRRLNL